jgi:hypothetical protein
MEATTIYKVSTYTNWKTGGSVLVQTLAGGAATPTEVVDLSSYYTKSDLQTVGLASVHFDNITNAYHNHLLGLEGGESPSDDSSGTAGEYYHLSLYDFSRLTSLNFVHSLVEDDSDNSVHLVGDVTAPGNSFYYGTNASGTKGFYTILNLTGVFQLTYSSATYGTTIKISSKKYATTDGYNIWIGADVGGDHLTGSDDQASYNTAMGASALHNVTTGSFNTAFGISSAYDITTGSYNTAIGIKALNKNTTGSYNTAIGIEAGVYYTGGFPNDTTVVNNSIYVGALTRSLANNQTNEIVIGYGVTGTGSNTVIIGNTSIVQTTLKGTVITDASTTTRAGLNLPHGAAPTAPVNGDVWTTSAGIYVRINGATVGPLS